MSTIWHPVSVLMNFWCDIDQTRNKDSSAFFEHKGRSKFFYWRAVHFWTHKRVYQTVLKISKKIRLTYTKCNEKHKSNTTPNSPSATSNLLITLYFHQFLAKLTYYCRARCYNSGSNNRYDCSSRNTRVKICWLRVSTSLLIVPNPNI